MNHDARPDLASLTRGELCSFVRSWSLPRYRGDQVFAWIWGKGVRSFEAMTDLPAALRQRLVDEATLRTPKVARVDVSVDGTRKLVVRFDDDREVETVIIPDGRRVTLCVSSQVGCALACSFCATGTMGLVRHLTAGEIAGQVHVASELLRRDPGDLDVRDERPITNIVYMGMGEPLHNYDETLRSLRILIDDAGYGYAPRRITVSTVGLVPKMRELGAEIPVTLAVSLHAGDDDVRGRLMPVNSRYSIEKVIEACRSFPLKARERITFEYVLLHGVNDREEDAIRLAALLEGLPCKVNLIPFNEHPGAAFERPDAAAVRRFDTVLTERGVPTFVRTTRGRDIAAACGQLALRKL